MPKENISISTCKVLGKAGENHEFSYGCLTFSDSGYIEIYGNVTITIDTLINNKTNSTYDFKVFGNSGVAGADSEGANGEDGEQTILLMIIEELKSSIRLHSIGGNGGHGSKSADGTKAGKGGAAGACPTITITYAEKALYAAISIDLSNGKAGISRRRSKKQTRK